MTANLGIVPGVRRLERRRAPTASPWFHIDWILVAAVVVLMAIGAVMVFSASRARLEAQNVSATFLLYRQLVFMGIGVVVVFALNVVDYRRYGRWAPGLYIGLSAALLLVLTPLGREVNGTRGWFEFGALQIQPAEYGKVILVVALAVVAAQGEGTLDRKRFMQLLALVAAPIALLILQPDLGSVMVYSALLLTILLIGGARPRHIAALAIVGALCVMGAFQLGVVKDYQRARLTCFLDGKASVRAECYNIRQSGIAVGSGGLTGKGLFKGTQTKGNFIPEQHNDFIFAAIGEELGFVGALAVIALYGVIVWRGIRTAQLARDFFGALVAMGVAAVIAFQAFLNIAVTIGVMPVTGVTLPLVSYGGSSVLTTAMLVALLINVQARRFSS